MERGWGTWGKQHSTIAFQARIRKQNPCRISGSNRSRWKIHRIVSKMDPQVERRQGQIVQPKNIVQFDNPAVKSILPPSKPFQWKVKFSKAKFSRPDAWQRRPIKISACRREMVELHLRGILSCNLSDKRILPGVFPIAWCQ